MKGGAILIVLLMMISLSLLLNPVSSENAKGLVIVWRNDVGQYYGYNMFSQLAADLRSNGVNTTYYNVSTFFTGSKNVDVNVFGSPKDVVIIIPNPPRDFNSTELAFLKNFVYSGGHIIVMGDVQYGDRHYGKPDYLNNLLSYIGIRDKVSFWGTNSNGDEIKDGTHNIGYPWQVLVDSKYFAPTIIAAGIKQVVIDSASLNVTNNTYILATTSPTAYAEDTSGKQHSVGNIPWLAAAEAGDGKVVLCGSTKMFTDASPYGKSIPYIKQADNEQLFFNIIWWLTGKRMVAAKPLPLMGWGDIFPVIAGILAGIFIRREEKINYKSFGYVTVIAATILALSPTIQVMLFGQVIVGTFISGWGEVVKTPSESMPSELVAFFRYFFIDIGWIFLGLIIVLAIEWVDRYLELGIMNKIGVSKRQGGE